MVVVLEIQLQIIAVVPKHIPHFTAVYFKLIADMFKNLNVKNMYFVIGLNVKSIVLVEVRICVWIHQCFFD